MKQELFPWRIWAIATLLSVALLVGVVIGEGETITPLGWASLLISLTPLLGAQLALGVPTAATQFKSWLQAQKNPVFPIAVFISALYLIGDLLAPGFDPYATLIFVTGTFAALGTLWQAKRGTAGISYADAAVWLLLWIPFDLRWNYDLWSGVDGFAYNWWAVALSVLAVVGWYGLRDLPNFGYRLIPNRRDIAVGLLALVIFAAIVIPVGLAIDFLTFPPSNPPTLSAILVGFIGLFLTVAIPEELFFRGILLHSLDQMSLPKWLNLLLSSLAFGLMHWNNADDLTTKIAYCALATVAGAFYGWAYRRSGNNLLAAVITHTLTDVMWGVLFQ